MVGTDGNSSAIRSTVSPFTREYSPSSSGNQEYRHPGSPTESVNSNPNASKSARSGHAGHSASSVGDPNNTIVYTPQLNVHDNNRGPIVTKHAQYDTPQYPSGSSQQYFMPEGLRGYSRLRVTVPEVPEAGDNFRISLSHVPGQQAHIHDLAGSSTSSTPKVPHSRLPEQFTYTLQPPSPDDPENYLRHTLLLPQDKPVDLWALPDPPERGKPNHPYSTLIKLAIFGSREKQLTLREILDALIDRFEWFKDNENEITWKNSVRHNLSFKKAFVGIPRPVTHPGKGSYWRLDLSEGKGSTE